MTTHIAQRLARKIYLHCRQDMEPTASLLQSLGAKFTEPGLEFFHGSGGSSCHQGYIG